MEWGWGWEVGWDIGCRMDGINSLGMGGMGRGGGGEEKAESGWGLGG